MDLQGKHLFEGLARRGHEVTVITSRHPEGKEYEEINGVRIHYLARTVFGSPRRGWAGESLKKFESIAAGEGTDLVLSQHAAACGVAARARKMGLPVVSIMHGYETMMFRSTLNAVLNFKEGWLGLPKAFFSMFYYTFAHELPVLWYSTAVIAISENVRRAVLRRMCLAKGVVRLVHCGIDTGRFRPSIEVRKDARRKLDLSEGEKVILFLSLLTRQKGVDVAIKAFKELEGRKSLRMIIAGDGECLEDTRALAARLGVAGRITFVGYVLNERAHEYYNASDIFIFPTIREESFGIVAAEAMACARPVVASRTGTVPEVIDDGLNGILVAPGNFRELAQKIGMLLDNAEYANRLAQNACCKAKEKFGLDRMLEDTLSVFEKARALVKKGL